MRNKESHIPVHLCTLVCIYSSPLTFASELLAQTISNTASSKRRSSKLKEEATPRLIFFAQRCHQPVKYVRDSFQKRQVPWPFPMTVSEARSLFSNPSMHQGSLKTPCARISRYTFPANIDAPLNLRIQCTLTFFNDVSVEDQPRFEPLYSLKRRVDISSLSSSRVSMIINSISRTNTQEPSVKLASSRRANTLTLVSEPSCVVSRASLRRFHVDESHCWSYNALDLGEV